MTVLDTTEIEIVYEQNIVQIYRFFYYKTLSKEKAEDLASETFLTFINQIKKNKTIGNPRNFLFGIAKNVFLKFLRKKYRDELTFDENHIENFAQYTQNFLQEIDQKPTLEDKALKFILKLPEKQKQVLYMRLMDKMKLNEIAEKLGKNMNYVKTTQKRGIKNLKKLIALS
ncbi:MAG: sigma-70 family RNA polymerase sigma factor [Candidatus Dojkabacteria bacterium]|nr:sigma-70 family RNA polymerase sigma factor [Candidatus Dojkabacteria bacterium]